MPCPPSPEPVPGGASAARSATARPTQPARPHDPNRVQTPAAAGAGRLADRNDNQHRRTAALALTGTAAPVMATEPKPPNPRPTGSTSAVPPVTAANAPVAVTV
jgi:hypothetical protein